MVATRHHAEKRARRVSAKSVGHEPLARDEWLEIICCGVIADAKRPTDYLVNWRVHSDCGARIADSRGKRCEKDCALAGDVPDRGWLQIVIGRRTLASFTLHHAVRVESCGA